MDRSWSNFKFFELYLAYSHKGGQAMQHYPTMTLSSLATPNTLTGAELGRLMSFLRNLSAIAMFLDNTAEYGGGIESSLSPESVTFLLWLSSGLAITTCPLRLADDRAVRPYLSLHSISAPAS